MFDADVDAAPAQHALSLVTGVVVRSRCWVSLIRRVVWARSSVVVAVAGYRRPASFAHRTVVPPNHITSLSRTVDTARLGRYFPEGGYPPATSLLTSDGRCRPITSLSHRGLVSPGCFTTTIGQSVLPDHLTSLPEGQCPPATSPLPGRSIPPAHITPFPEGRYPPRSIALTPQTSSASLHLDNDALSGVVALLTGRLIC